MDTNEEKKDLVESAEDAGVSVEVKTGSNTDQSTAVEIAEDGTLSSPGDKITPSVPAESSETSEHESSVVETEHEDPIETKSTQEEEEATSQSAAEDSDAAVPSVEPESTQGDSSQLEQPQHSDDHNQMAIPPQPARHGKPKAAIIVAVIIVIALIGVSVVAFMKMNQKKPVKSTKNTTSQTTKVEKKEVTADDVSATSTEVETNINKTDDAKDLPTAESVNDKSLGL